MKGELDNAIADFNRAIELDPNYAVTRNYLAWIYATNPKANYRNGQKAIENATRACELTLWKNAYYLDTLAAAFAEAG